MQDTLLEKKFYRLMNRINHIWNHLIKNTKTGMDVARMGGQERCIQRFGGETCGHEPLGRPRRRW
jgi:hypothetical protein